MESELVSPHDEFLRNYFQDKGKEKLLDLFIKHLQSEHHLSIEDVNRLVEEKQKEILLPISIFDNDDLSALETISKYLKENQKLRFHDIAVGLNRDDRAIWATYKHAKEKMPGLLKLKPSRYFIPARIFTGRKLSVLESIAKYLKENFGLSYREIAILLRRNERTIWTVYSRAKKKENVKQ